MTSKYRVAIPAVVAGALGIGGAAAVAAAAEPTTAELMAQIQQLQAKVQHMESTQTSAVSSKEADATIDSVLKDADRRSQLMQMEGFTAGWNRDHFQIGSADGNFTLIPSLQFQFRNITDYRQNGKNDGDDIQNGFEVSRMKLELMGNAFTPDLTYNFRWASGENNGGSSLSLENAYVQYKFADNLSVRLGQYKDNWTHEENVSSKRQLAVDRSLLNEVLGGGLTDYVQGIALIYDTGGNFRGELAYHDGLNTDNTNFQDVGGVTTSPLGIATGNTDFGVTGRIEWAAMGDFKHYDQFTAMGNDSDLLVIGAGGEFSQSSSNNFWFHTVDAQWDPAAVHGLSLYAAYVGLWQDLGGVVDSDFYNWGILVQAGYMVNDRWEIFGRWDYTKVDDDLLPAGSEDEFHELTFGVNYYMQGHNAKVTVDLNWLPNGAPAGVSNIGYGGTDDDEFTLRGQFQLCL